MKRATDHPYSNTQQQQKGQNVARAISVTILLVVSPSVLAGKKRYSWGDKKQVASVAVEVLRAERLFV